MASRRGQTYMTSACEITETSFWSWTLGTVNSSGSIKVSDPVVRCKYKVGEKPFSPLTPTDSNQTVTITSHSPPLLLRSVWNPNPLGTEHLQACFLRDVLLCCDWILSIQEECEVLWQSADRLKQVEQWRQKVWSEGHAQHWHSCSM